MSVQLYVQWFIYMYSEVYKYIYVQWNVQVYVLVYLYLQWSVEVYECRRVCTSVFICIVKCEVNSLWSIFYDVDAFLHILW